jgi:hypothetical protein
MKRSLLLQAILGVTVCLLLGYSLLITLESRASIKTLRSIQNIKPGQDISEIRHALGKEMNEYKEKDEIMSFGSVKDPQFCEGKNLYWFYVSTPPCRVVEVYTNQNGKVEFVTWQGL